MKQKLGQKENPIPNYLQDQSLTKICYVLTKKLLSDFTGITLVYRKLNNFLVYI